MAENVPGLPLASTARARVFYGWWVTAVATITMVFVGGILFYTFGIFLVALNRDFQWSVGQISLASFFYFLVAGVSGPFVGRMIARFGVRRVLAASAFAAGGVLVLLSQIGALWQLYLLYLVLGVFYAGSMQIPISTLMASWFERRRGLATGIAVNGIGLGGTLMAPVTQGLIAAVDWRFAYVVIGAIIWVLVVPLVVVVVRNRPRDVGLLPDGDTAEAVGRRQQADVVRLGAAIPMRAAVVTVAFWFIALAYFFTQLANFATLIHQPKFLQGQGADPAAAAAVLSLTAFAGAAGKILLGILADRVGHRRRLFAATGVLQAVGIVLFLSAPSLTVTWLAAILFGLGMGGNFTLQALVVAEVFGLADYASIFGALTSAGVLGGAVGPMIAGAIFDLTQSYVGAFTFFIASYALSAAFMLLVRPVRRPTQE